MPITVSIVKPTNPPRHIGSVSKGTCQRRRPFRHTRAFFPHARAFFHHARPLLRHTRACRRPLYNLFPPPAGGDAEGGGGPAPPSAICYLRQQDPLSRSATAPPARGSNLIKGLRLPRVSRCGQYRNALHVEIPAAEGGNDGLGGPGGNYGMGCWGGLLQRPPQDGKSKRALR